jgi:hypothetical protein
MENQSQVQLVSIESWLGKLHFTAVISALAYENSAYYVGLPGIAVKGQTAK